VVIYKVDRLTRSLADFAKLVELFDQYRVSIVSITQSFNTTSSMARLTLNVLLSFAEFEREVIGDWPTSGPARSPSWWFTRSTASPLARRLRVDLFDQQGVSFVSITQSRPGYASS
jgi:Resolvase, N terminal domain